MARTEQEMEDLILNATDTVADDVVESFLKNVPRWKRRIVDSDDIWWAARLATLNMIRLMASVDRDSAMTMLDEVARQSKTRRCRCR